MFGAPDGVVVVFYHHQGIAIAFEPGQRAEQDSVVTRVQADGGFVQDVADAL